MPKDVLIWPVPACAWSTRRAEAFRSAVAEAVVRRKPTQVLMTFSLGLMAKKYAPVTLIMMEVCAPEWA